MVFQKYFDQWDYALKQLGERMLQIMQNNWNAEKIKLMIGEEPTEFFYSKVFSSCQTVVEEGLLTPTQRNLQAQAMLDINTAFGREVLPPSMIIPVMNIQGKTEIVEFLKMQEEQASKIQEEETVMRHAFEDAKLKELYSKATSNLATARERHGRSESNIGLFEERLSMIARNRSLATKDKMEALSKLLESIQMYGGTSTAAGESEIDSMNADAENTEDREKIDARVTSESSKFLEKIMGGMDQQYPGSMGEQETAPQEMAEML